jgi:hypothetical protein
MAHLQGVGMAKSPLAYQKTQDYLLTFLPITVVMGSEKCGLFMESDPVAQNRILKAMVDYVNFSTMIILLCCPHHFSGISPFCVSGAMHFASALHLDSLFVPYPQGVFGGCFSQFRLTTAVPILYDSYEMITHHRALPNIHVHDSPIFPIPAQLPLSAI